MKNNQEMLIAVKVSVFCNIILFAIKAITLLLVNSLAVAADLGISIIALIVSGFLYYTIKMSDKPADIFHNYGYGKIENVAEAIEGVVLIGLAISMSVTAIMHLAHPEEIRFPLIGFVASFLGVVINFWGAGFIFKLAQKHSSPALKAEALHFKLEGFISLSIAFSFALVMVFHYAGFSLLAIYVDPVATLIVSALIAIPSVRLLKEAYMKLLDASIEEISQMAIIKALARHHDRYCNFKNIRTRSAGRKNFIDLHLVMPEHLSVKKAHDIAVALKHEINSSVGESEVSVHIEPCNLNCSFSKNNQRCPYV